MPQGSGSVQPRMFSRRLIKILTVMERFRQEAEERGHLPFADALQSCTLEISGGNMDCPLGKLVVDESARTGVFMAFNLNAPAPRREVAPPAGRQASTDISSATILEWQSKYSKLWNLLKEDAKLARDTDCLEALEACNDLTQTNHRCPVRDLIAQGLSHGGKS
ncbi:MAG TPA: hypothetical protein VES96_07510 [Nitrospiraceae bacterium]|nr:hypothetical protein [Nitrospiraceae bacterium]